MTGRLHNHFLPDSHLFTPQQRSSVITSDVCLIAMGLVLAAGTWFLGPIMMTKLYWAPFWVFVAWLTSVTYLHHHGSHDPTEKMPWYR